MVGNSGWRVLLVVVTRSPTALFSAYSHDHIPIMVGLYGWSVLLGCYYKTSKGYVVWPASSFRTISGKKIDFPVNEFYTAQVSATYLLLRRS